MNHEDLEVIKLGGSILQDSDAFQHAVDIVEEELGKNRLPICVVSAMKGVTDKIINAVNMSHGDPLFKPREFVESLLEDHIKALPKGEDTSEELADEFEKLLHVLAYIKSSGELTDSVYAYAVSRGENFSSRMLSIHFQNRGISNQCIYGEEILVTDENYKEAKVDLEKTKELLNQKLKEPIELNRVLIIAGFAGRSVSGRVTILGRGGTDDTAVNIAYGLGIKRVIKYVNEHGIMTIDPKFIEDLKENYPDLLAQFYDLPDPQVIPYISYVEASELLREGRTKVVHYKVLNPLMKGDIEFHIKNYFNNGSDGTVIGRVEEAIYENKEPRPKAISYQRNLYGVRLLPTQSVTPSEVYSKVFSALSGTGVDIRYLSTSGYQMSFLMPKDDVAVAVEALSGLDVAMEVSPMKGRKGTFSVIGSEMRGMKGFFSRLTGVLARHGVNIEQAIQPNSENIIRFSLDDADIPMAVTSVYNEFFR